MWWGTLEGWRQGSGRAPEKFDGWNHYQNSAGADSLESGLQTEDHVPRENIQTQSTSCMNGDDQHMRVHLCSKGHILTPALQEIPCTRAERLLKWQGRKHPLNGRENLHHWAAVQPEQDLYSNVYWGGLGAHGGHHTSFVWVWVRVFHQGVTPLHFCKRRVKLVPKCIKRMCYKAMWNPLTRTSSMVFQQDSTTANKAKTTQEWLRRNFLLHRELAFRESRLQPLDCKPWATNFQGHGLPKAS